MYKRPYLISLLLPFFLTSCKNRSCLRNDLIDQRFEILASDTNKHSFVLSDTVSTEYLNNNLLHETKIEWSSCNSYLMHLYLRKNRVEFPDDSFLLIESLKLKNDTLFFSSRYNGKLYRFKAMRKE